MQQGVALSYALYGDKAFIDRMTLVFYLLSFLNL